MPFDDWINLLLNIVEIIGPFFWLSWRDSGVLHLMIGGILFQFVRFSRFIFPAKDSIGNLVEEILKDAAVLSPILILLQSAFKFLDLALSCFVIKFTTDRVEEINTTEGTCDNGKDWMASLTELDFSAATDVGEHITFTHFDQGQFDIIGVSSIVLKTMRRSSQESKGLIEIFLVLVSGVTTTKFN